MTVDLATPTGRLVLEHWAPRETWLAKRREGICSSDMPAILNLYRSPRHVYYDKTGRLPLDDEEWSEPMHFGLLFEAPLAHDWARRNRTVIEPVGLIANVSEPWQMCSLDRRCIECPMNRDDREVCAVEVKTRDKETAHLWRTGPPDDVLAQTLWQAISTGLDHVHVVCLLGGNDYRQYVVRVAEHPKLVALLKAEASRMWFDHVLAGVVPELTGDEPPGSLVALYQRLHPYRDGLVALDRQPDAIDHVTDYLAAVADESAAKRRKKAAYARMLETLGDAQMATVGGHPLYSIEQSHTRRADLNRLMEHHPEVYADCVEDKPGDRLHIPKRIREEYTL